MLERTDSNEPAPGRQVVPTRRILQLGAHVSASIPALNAQRLGLRTPPRCAEIVEVQWLAQNQVAERQNAPSRWLDARRVDGANRAGTAPCCSSTARAVVPGIQGSLLAREDVPTSACSSPAVSARTQKADRKASASTREEAFGKGIRTGHPRVLRLRSVLADTYPTLMEPGLLTLAKIVGTLVVCIGVVPLLFLLAPGAESGEPVLDDD